MFHLCDIARWPCAAPGRRSELPAINMFRQQKKVPTCIAGVDLHESRETVLSEPPPHREVSCRALRHHPPPSP